MLGLTQVPARSRLAWLDGLTTFTPAWFTQGVATSTRKAAMKLWKGRLPAGKDRDSLVRELYRAENRGKPYVSGSQVPGEMRIAARLDGEVIP